MHPARAGNSSGQAAVSMAAIHLQGESICKARWFGSRTWTMAGGGADATTPTCIQRVGVRWAQILGSDVSDSKLRWVALIRGGAIRRDTDAMAHRPDRRLGSIAGVHLTQQSFHVNLHRRIADAEITRDALV
jgi:hypothetical protein